MEMPKFSPQAMLRINLILGAFVALTNGGALFLAMSHGRGELAGHIGEAALWASAGAVIAVLSLIGMARPEYMTSILEKQVVAVFALIGALALWGFTVATGVYRLQGTFGWSAGFLSMLGLYCYVLYSNVSSIRGWASGLRAFAIAFVLACIAIDVAAFMAVMKA